MRKIRTIIIEDIEQDLETAQTYLNTYCPQVEIIGVAKNVNAAYDLIVEKKPDFVLSDIQIEGEGTAFDVFKRLKADNVAITFEVIFMTGHLEGEYSTKAFKYSAIDFISKPFGKDEIIEAVGRLEEKITLKEAKILVDNLVDVLEKDGFISDFITVHLANKRTQRIPINKIVYLQAETILTHIYLIDGEEIIAFRNLGKYREVLENDYNFYSIKNSICVNLAHKTNYNHSTFEMTMKNGKILQGSREFCKKYYAFMKEMGEEGRQEKKTLIEKIKKFFGL